MNTAPIADGAKKWVKVYVNYRYEFWPAVTEPTYGYYEILTPVTFGGWNWGSDISAASAGGGRRAATMGIRATRRRPSPYPSAGASAKLRRGALASPSKRFTDP